MCLHFKRTLNRRGMERKKVLIELDVRTEHWRDRDIERDVIRLVMPLKNVESGNTVVDEVEIKEVR